MSLIPVLIIILGIGVGVLIYFGIRSFLLPKKVVTLSNLVKEGKIPAAVRLAKQILTKDSRNGEARFLLGKAYLADGRHELALMELKTVNHISTFGGFCPEADFRILIAELYERFKQPEEALKEYLVLSKLQPKVAEHRYKAGVLFELRDMSDRAITFYRQTIELAPKHADAHYRLGYLLVRYQKPLEAKTELELSVKYQPDNYKAYFFLGRLLRDSRDYVGALHSFEKSQRDAEFKVKSLVERGGCFMNMQNYDLASIELERAVKLAEDGGSKEMIYARYFLATCYERMNRVEKSIEQWEKIYLTNRTFKDVSEKLRQYADLRTDDHMKDFLTAGQDEFTEICKGVAEYLKLKVRDVELIQNGCQVVGIDREANWINSRTMPRMLWFLRVPELIDESTVRSFHEEMRKLQVTKGFIVASTNFSTKAGEFAESRPIELVNKASLQEMLRKVEFVPEKKQIR